MQKVFPIGEGKIILLFGVFTEFMGLKVPDVLVSGNHQEVEKWRQQQSLERTKQNRSDLLE